jgi:hypothetical protein
MEKTWTPIFLCEIMDSHLELETNTRVRAEMEKLGGQICKRYRIYGKDLDAVDITFA